MPLFSQVGIGTVAPQSTLHVEGTFQVSDTNDVCDADKLAGIGPTGRVTNVIVGENLTLTGNVLSANTGNNNAFYKIATIPISTPFSNFTFNDFDMDISGVNNDVVIFRLVGATTNFSISGIIGGTDGRHIIIYNANNVNMKIDHLVGSLPQNQIDTLGPSTATSGIGTVELVYDGTLLKWIVVNIRD
ncbi:hypothetical protein KK2020170_19510 [Flavobacterium okayamense]|uniref:Uncharacterized protein n=2 Tax=Flavobacterium okayamense TaxID=2830782 RepID=A0ABN6HXE7_9FLAO|nr:hypothetical protein KK2020170_19510 [Flavobacterium okayamense]